MQLVDSVALPLLLRMTIEEAQIRETLNLVSSPDSPVVPAAAPALATACRWRTVLTARAACDRATFAVVLALYCRCMWDILMRITIPAESGPSLSEVQAELAIGASQCRDTDCARQLMLSICTWLVRRRIERASLSSEIEFRTPHVPLTSIQKERSDRRRWWRNWM